MAEGSSLVPCRACEVVQDRLPDSPRCASCADRGCFVMIGRHDVRGSKEECERIQRDNLKRAAEGRLRDTDVAYYDVKCR